MDSLTVAQTTGMLPLMLHSILRYGHMLKMETAYEKSASIINFVLHNPAAEKMTLNEAQALCQILKDKLSHQAWQRAKSRGQTLTLQDVVSLLEFEH